jgi:hypothetical protein
MKMQKNCVLNGNGVVIKKCCASCEHKEIGRSDNQRICMMGEGEVPKDYLCPDWAMSQLCKNITLVHRGRVKKPHYIAWCKAELDKIALSEVNKKTKDMAIASMPERYESEYGTRYM